MIKASSQAPLVSVVMTAYNGTQYLRATIDSILGQSLTDFEFIVVDDCSKDATVELIQSYQDPRIVLVRNDRNLGISDSRNAAIRLARGEFVAMTDQDDISEVDRLVRQVQFLRNHPDCVAVASKVYLLMQNKRIADPMPVQGHPVLVNFAMYFGRHNTTYSSLCLRRQVIEDNGLYFRKEFHYAEDYELFSRIMKLGQVHVLPEELVGYRLHASNNSKLHYDEMSRNGMRFMRACYESELGRAVSEREGWQIWHGLVEKRPHASCDELRESGRLMTELTQKFLGHMDPDDLLVHKVRILAAEIWHDVVDRSTYSAGFEVDRVRGEFTALLTWSPTASAKTKTRLLGMFGFLRQGFERISNSIGVGRG